MPPSRYTEIGASALAEYLQDRKEKFANYLTSKEIESCEEILESIDQLAQKISREDIALTVDIHNISAALVIPFHLMDVSRQLTHVVHGEAHCFDPLGIPLVATKKEPRSEFPYLVCDIEQGRHTENRTFATKDLPENRVALLLEEGIAVFREHPSILDAKDIHGFAFRGYHLDGVVPVGISLNTAKRPHISRVPDLPHSKWSVLTRVEVITLEEGMGT